MICEKCKNDHNGVYGSGRFCSSLCARSFSTVKNRTKINEKISISLTGKPHPRVDQTEETKQKRKNSWTEEHRIKASLKRIEQEKEKYQNTPFDKLSRNHKKRFVLENQNQKCLSCGNDEWLGHTMKFELDHINGDNRDNRRENLRCLCPNCHSFTDTWRKKKASVAE